MPSLANYTWSFTTAAGAVLPMQCVEQLNHTGHRLG